MKTLTTEECSFISAGTNDVVMTDGQWVFSGFLVLGCIGGIVGIGVGTSHFGVIGILPGWFLGTLAGSVGGPVAVVGSLLLSACTYKILGMAPPDVDAIS